MHLELFSNHHLKIFGREAAEKHGSAAAGY